MRKSSFAHLPSLFATFALFLVSASAAHGRALTPGFNANTVQPNDDGSSSEITLPFTINFFGTNYGRVFVNNNGNLTFNTSLAEFTPSGLQAAAVGLGGPIIAPFWADVDTRGTDCSTGGPGTGSGQAKYGTGTFNNRPAFGATWLGVGYYQCHVDLLNSFQVILVDRSDVAVGAFDIVFNYQQIQWETGDASDGVGGLGGTPAAVGYSNGTNGGTFQLPGSLVSRSFLDGGSLSLVANSNVNSPGQYVFPVRGGQVQNPTPALSSLTPTGAVVNTPGPLTVTVNGTGFINGSTVQVNGATRTATFLSSRAMTFQLTGPELAVTNSSGFNITVTSPSPGGGVSNTIPFPVIRALTDLPLSAPPIVDTRTSSTADSSSSPNSTVQPTCGSHSVSRGVWMRYHAVATGFLTVDLTGTAYQALLNLFTGVFSANGALNLTSTACQEGSVAISRSTGERVVIPPKVQNLPVTAGQDVWVLVTSSTGAGGALNASTSFRATAPIQDGAQATMMPHVVYGGGYVTKLTLINMSGGQNNVSVNFVDNTGAVVNSVTRLMNIGEALRIDTGEANRFNPQACCTTQWAVINSDARIVANLFYEIATPNGTVINTVGLNDDGGATGFTIPVEFQPGPAPGVIGRTVGLALSNPNNTQVTTNLTLRNAAGTQCGNQVGITLDPFAHTQHSLDFDFASVLPPNTTCGGPGVNDVIGTIVGSTSPSLPVSVVAVGDDFGPFFSTPPVTGGTHIVIPHIATGFLSNTGYISKITVMNLTSTTANITVKYFNGSTQVATSPYNIPPKGALRLPSLSCPAPQPMTATSGYCVDESERFATFTERWATIDSNVQIATNLFFEVEDTTPQHNVINTIGFNNAQELSAFTLPAELEPALGSNGGQQRTIGLVMANGGASTANVTLKLYNSDGTLRACQTPTGGTTGGVTCTASANLAMAAGTQVLMSVNLQFAASLPNANFMGTLVVMSCTNAGPCTTTNNVVNSPAFVSAVALQADYGPFSAIPLIGGIPQP
jgi:hypothetical protein